MFKIYKSKDKAYYVIVTKEKNIVAEIFRKTSESGNILNLHEEHLDLCRAILAVQKEGYSILKVVTTANNYQEALPYLEWPEYIEAVKHPKNDIDEAVLTSYYDSGAAFQIPCKVNKTTHEVFDFECCAMPEDNDSFEHAEVEVDDSDYPLNYIDSIMDENDVDDALDEYYRIQQNEEYWQSFEGRTLESAIHECRWKILKDAIIQRGHEAVADLVGTDISSSSYERLMDETEAQMPTEEFEKFWEKYI